MAKFITILAFLLIARSDAAASFSCKSLFFEKLTQGKMESELFKLESMYEFAYSRFKASSEKFYSGKIPQGFNGYLGAEIRLEDISRAILKISKRNFTQRDADVLSDKIRSVVEDIKKMERGIDPNPPRRGSRIHIK